MGGICPCGSVIMNVIDIAKAAFDALPKVQRVWVDAKGQFHLHPDNGGTLVERHPVAEDNSVVVETKKKKKK